LSRRGGVVYCRQVPSVSGNGKADPAQQAEALTRAFRETAQFYGQLNTRRPVDRIYLVGGGAREGDLTQRLGAATGIPAEVLDAAQHLAYSPGGKSGNHAGAADGRGAEAGRRDRPRSLGADGCIGSISIRPDRPDGPRGRTRSDRRRFSRCSPASMPSVVGFFLLTALGIRTQAQAVEERSRSLQSRLLKPANSGTRAATNQARTLLERRASRVLWTPALNQLRANLPVELILERLDARTSESEDAFSGMQLSGRLRAGKNVDPVVNCLDRLSASPAYRAYFRQGKTGAGGHLAGRGALRDHVSPDPAGDDRLGRGGGRGLTTNGRMGGSAGPVAIAVLTLAGLAAIEFGIYRPQRARLKAAEAALASTQAQVDATERRRRGGHTRAGNVRRGG
jgi:hypothetical protein